MISFFTVRFWDQKHPVPYTIFFSVLCKERENLAFIILLSIKFNPQDEILQFTNAVRRELCKVSVSPGVYSLDWIHRFRHSGVHFLNSSFHFFDSEIHFRDSGIHLFDSIIRFSDSGFHFFDSIVPRFDSVVLRGGWILLFGGWILVFFGLIGVEIDWMVVVVGWIAIRHE